MEVRVDTYVESLDGMRHPVNRAYLTLVSVDKNGKSKEVPRLIVESVGEQAEWVSKTPCILFLKQHTISE